MRAVVVHETGDPDVLREEQIDRPEPGDGEVLISVRAASVNPIDWKYRRGLASKQLPAVLGSDVSGTVEVSRAEAFEEGDEVFGFARSGAYAEFAAAPAGMIARKPPGLTHEQAAALPVAGLTAWQALFDRGDLRSGQAALIAGAAGGVGHLAVQLAARAGADTTGIGSPRNRDFVLALGAHGYVDYTSEDPASAAAGADLSFDAVGGPSTAQLLAATRAGGTLVTIANAAPEQEASERRVRAELLIMSPDAGQLAEIGGLVAAGEIRVEIAETFPLADVARAHEASEAGHTRGKLVLAVSG